MNTKSQTVFYYIRPDGKYEEMIIEIIDGVKQHETKTGRIFEQIFSKNERPEGTEIITILDDNFEPLYITLVK